MSETNTLPYINAYKKKPIMTDFVSMLISYVAMFSCGLLLGWNLK